MKFKIYSSIIVLVAVVTFSFGQDSFKSAQFQGNGSFMDQHSMAVREMPAERTIESKEVMAFAGYRSGEVDFKNGKQVKVGYLNVDLETQLVYFKSGDIYFEVQPDVIDKLVIDNSTYGWISVKNKSSMIFSKLYFNDGNYSLSEGFFIKTIKANYNSALNTGSQVDSKTKESVLVVGCNNILVEVPGSKRKFANLFVQSDQVFKLIKEKDLDIQILDDLKLIVTSIDGLDFKN